MANPIPAALPLLVSGLSATSLTLITGRGILLGWSLTETTGAPDAATVVGSTVATVTGNSGALVVGDGGVLNLLAQVTAISGGTPGVTFSVQWSDDGTNWAPATGAGDAFAQITTVSNLAAQFQVKGSYYRVIWTLQAGTTSVTFSIQQSRPFASRITLWDGATPNGLRIGQTRLAALGVDDQWPSLPGIQFIAGVTIQAVGFGNVSGAVFVIPETGFGYGLVDRESAGGAATAEINDYFETANYLREAG